MRVIEDARTTRTLPQVDTLRQIIGDVARNADPGERRIARIMQNRLDEQIENLRPTDVLAGDAAAGTAAIHQARALWTRYRKGHLIDDALERAARQAASTYSGGNLDNAIRQKIRQLRDSPNRIRGFTQAELAAMDRVIAGGPVQNFLRWAGRFSPSGLMGMLGVSATAINPAFAAIPTAGFFARQVGTALTRRNAANLSGLVRRGYETTLTPGQLSRQRRMGVGGISATIQRKEEKE